MQIPRSVEDLFSLYESRGDRHYGEFVTQTDHALQCAALARADGVSDELVVAALFHDVGHLVADVQDDEGFRLDEEDDDHEELGARILAPILGPDVARPVALHVTAKRWRCARDPAYVEALSPASRATLIVQGGPLSDAECRRFEDQPGFADALALRTWDDTGKTPGLEVGRLRDYEGLVTAMAAAWSRARRES